MPNRKLPRIGYKKILYVTDLSEEGRLAFPHAASLAHTYDAALTVFHVVESREFEKFLEGYFNEELWNEIRNRNVEEAREILVNRKRSDTSIKEGIE
ncbi:MAG: universal stress protein, partial [Candidatus Thiodiazotropha endolucinida]